MESDSDVLNFSAGLRSENTYILNNKFILVSHLDVKTYGSMKIHVSSVLTRNTEKGRMEQIILKKTEHQIHTVRNCTINVSILNLEHQCHIKTSG